MSIPYLTRHLASCFWRRKLAIENTGGGGAGGTKTAGGRRPAGGTPGGACGCRGRMAPLRARPGPFVNHLFHAWGIIIVA